MDLFFPLSKLLWLPAAPSNFLVLLGALGAILLILKARRLALACLCVCALGLLVLGFSPAASYVISPLEERFPIFHDDGRPVTGIIQLGGSEKPFVANGRGQVALNEAGERLVAFGDLARRYPEARLVFSGGSGLLLPGDAREAEMVRMSLKSIGVDEKRVTLEGNSRNTEENARFTRALINPQPGERWLLVTSASHMPRAIGCFRKAGIPVTAYPVDFQTAGPDELNVWNARAAIGLDMLDTAAREWVGLVVYHLTGKTSALFPAP